MNKSWLLSLVLLVSITGSHSVWAFPVPTQMRQGLHSIKLVLSDSRLLNYAQRYQYQQLARDVQYTVPRFGDASSKMAHILSSAEARGDISLFEFTRLGAMYRNFGNDAPRLLVRCLNVPRCDHQSFVTNQQRSIFHRQLSWAMPHLSPSAINHKVGELNERVMNNYYKESGWKQLPGEVGRNGIDGLFVKQRRDGSIRDVLISESKFNLSPLGYTNHGRQASQEWTLKKLDEVYRATGDPRYLEVRQFVERGMHRNILWRMRPVESGDGIVVEIQRQLIREEGGSLTFEEVRGGYRMLVDRVYNQTINFSQVQNAYQTRIVHSIDEVLNELIREEYERL